ncbi:MAG: hypothetical protein KDC07_11670 [Chitinophagaceae bacterium]|nr:hypothetical protein [Chitinophagaceae bacterium]
MKLKNNIMYFLLAGILTVTLFACVKEEDCTNSTANLPAPVPQAHFRIIDSEGRDLLASITPGQLSFDSLVAHQPCNISDALTKHINQTGAGGLESYVFYFDGLHQPITGENMECFTLELHWTSSDVDIIKFNSRAEHHVCGVTYYLDGVTFNGKEAKQDGNGNYLLQR